VAPGVEAAARRGKALMPQRGGGFCLAIANKRPRTRERRLWVSLAFVLCQPAKAENPTRRPKNKRIKLLFKDELLLQNLVKHSNLTPTKKIENAVKLALT
jgi:hypothetical protein